MSKRAGWKGKRGPRPGEKKAEAKTFDPVKGDQPSEEPKGAKPRDKGTVIRSTAPTPPAPQVPRKLTDAQLLAHATRAARLHQDADTFEELLKETTKRQKGELKKKRAEVARLLREVSSGVEMVAQGDMFVDGSTQESRAADTAEGGRIGEGDAKELIAEVATRAGDAPAPIGELVTGTGEGPFDFTGEEEPDKIAPAPEAQAGA